jgi:RNA polymerase sigma-70 factor (ECF subfamily)
MDEGVRVPSQSISGIARGSFVPGSIETEFPALYQELRHIAASYLRTERSGHTLQPTALVHEAYLKLVALDRIEWANRPLVLGLAAGIMRRILVNHARRRNALKRAQPVIEIELDSATGSESKTCDTLLLHDLLTRMEQLHAGAAKVIELRFFGGLTEEESAAFLGLSRATVQRQYSFAKAWLFRELGGTPASRQ